MYHVGIGIVGTVYAGTTRKLKDGNEAWIKKDDVTKEFLGVMVEYLKFNNNDVVIAVSGTIIMLILTIAMIVVVLK